MENNAMCYFPESLIQGHRACCISVSQAFHQISKKEYEQQVRYEYCKGLAACAADLVEKERKTTTKFVNNVFIKTT